MDAPAAGLGGRIRPCVEPIEATKQTNAPIWTGEERSEEPLEKQQPIASSRPRRAQQQQQRRVLSFYFYIRSFRRAKSRRNAHTTIGRHSFCLSSSSGHRHWWAVKQ